MHKFFLLLFILILISCQAHVHVHERSTIPADSFVFVDAKLHVEACKETEGMSVCVRDSFTSTGSGISIGSVKDVGSLILTAGHICEIQQNELPKGLTNHFLTFKVFDRFGRAGQATIVNTSFADPDICALFVKSLKIKGVKISKDEPYIGDKIYSLSAPLGIFHPPAVPVLEGTYSGQAQKGEFSVTTIRAIGGCSGSGILNQKGELIGILFATHPSFNSITLVSTYDSTLDFVNKTFKKLKE